MKKVILAALAVAAFAAANAYTVEPAAQKLLPAVPGGNFTSMAVEKAEKAIAKAPLKADEEEGSMIYSLAYDPYNVLGFQQQTPGLKVGIGFQMTKAEATKFAGNQISAINFYTPTNQVTDKNNIKSATVFLSYDQTKANQTFYTQEVALPGEALTYVSATLDKPYTIEEKSVFVGVIFTLVDPDDLTIVVDYMSHGNDAAGGWVGVDSGTGLQWQNISTQAGFVCVSATLTGTTLPKNELAVNDYALNARVEQNAPFGFQVLLENTASNLIKNMDFELSIGGQVVEEGTYEFTEPMAYKDQIGFSFGQLSYPEASEKGVPVSFTVKKVNGVDNNSLLKDIEGSIVVIPEGKALKQNVVVEEITSVGCGWCVIGISGMEAIREEFTEDHGMIPVAVHTTFNGADPMTATTFSAVVRASSGSLPGALLNREVEVYPTYEELIANYNRMRAVPALGEIWLEKEDTDNPNKVKLTATFRFAFDTEKANTKYRVAFAVTEDNVGPYNQTNYASGEGAQYGEWSKLPNPTSVVYNDVARQLNSFMGLANSVPETVKSMEEYTYSYELTLVNKINDKSKINFIAYLIDSKSTNKTVVNAATIKAGQTTGIENVETTVDPEAPVEYFNLQGMRVENPSNGIYIMRQGSKTSKVAF